jgi:hypothetical protein
VEARAFWRHGDQVRRWDRALVDTSDHGSFRLRGSAERPFGPGDGELILLVSRRGQLSVSIDGAQLADPPPAWRVVRRAVRWP